MLQFQSLPLASIGTPVSTQTASSTTIRTRIGSAQSTGVIGLEAHLQLLISPLKVGNSAPPETAMSNVMHVFCHLPGRRS